MAQQKQIQQHIKATITDPQVQDYIIAIVKNTPTHQGKPPPNVATKKAVARTLAILIPRLISSGSGSIIEDKMKPTINIFELVRSIRNEIGKMLVEKGMDPKTKEFADTVDRLSANIIYHIIKKQNFAQQQMQGQQGDKALFKELLKLQQGNKRMNLMSQFFYPPATGPAPAPTLDQKEKKRIMDEIEDCLKKYGVGGGGGGGGGGGP